MHFEKFIAHRGAREFHPENSMSAFKDAVKAGLNWIELDVQLSCDGQAFIFHDDSSQRLTGQDYPIAELAWAEICGLELCDENQKRAKIPSLAEYLNWAVTKTDLITNLELKVPENSRPEYEQKLAQTVIEILKEFPQLQHKILLSSFSQKVLASLSTINHRFPVEMLIFIHDSWEKEFKVFEDQHLANFYAWKCIGLGINNEFLNPERIKLLKQLCTHVLVYSGKSITDQDVKFLLGNGIDSVFIDYMHQSKLV